VQRTKNHRYFGSTDAFSGYWQLLLHEDTRELYSIMTDRGVYKPTRLPQGSVDAVQWFHGHLAEIFGELIPSNILQWIDDLCLHATTLKDLVHVWERVFELCSAKNIKLSPKKTHIYNPTAKFCGKVLDGDGWHIDPSCMDSLRNLVMPTNAEQLNQLLCAMNWTRYCCHSLRREGPGRVKD